MRYRSIGSDRFELPESWQELVNIVNEDRLLIHDVLASDASPEARTVATLLLVNFMDEDASWHALVGSAIDPVPQVTQVAMSMLSGLMLRKDGPVDWSGARTPLSAILAGTNPFPALRLLRAVSGEDFATDVDAWRSWIAG